MRNTYAAVTRRLNDPAFARQVIRYAFATLAGTVYLCCALTTGLVYELTHRPRPQHIYHDSMGKPRELIVTDTPYFTDSQVMNWVTDKVTNLYTLNYLDYGKHLDGCAGDFTADAWNSWATAFQGRGNLDFIKSKMVLLTAALKSAASVDAQGTNRRGDYEWHVSFPMYLKWTNAGGAKTDVLEVRVTIRRTNDPLHPAGLVIAQLNAHKIAGGEN
ncbi:DotI/IcmL family type IV secretion protein [Acetobacter sp. TBRC 12305]|uniref:DotI/IcmL/TraM family protein n=1 Tax=Acetobacter garciniae TaxID=2817435 RepID=A0A939HKV5_9PROT|nr:DotI/IcmL/TraM family protein [Acetobacter garciniae]MBO1326285.1 DotI/IcmL/TraM family protein [Acetobacter garciniae]MBX0345976.1 DotI/IcmL family type IV secretion protein [Acetobacter garciniae]